MLGSLEEPSVVPIAIIRKWMHRKDKLSIKSHTAESWCQWNLHMVHLRQSQFSIQVTFSLTWTWNKKINLKQTSSSSRKIQILPLLCHGKKAKRGHRMEITLCPINSNEKYPNIRRKVSPCKSWSVSTILNPVRTEFYRVHSHQSYFEIWSQNNSGLTTNLIRLK